MNLSANSSNRYERLKLIELGGRSILFNCSLSLMRMKQSAIWSDQFVFRLEKMLNWYSNYKRRWRSGYEPLFGSCNKIVTEWRSRSARTRAVKLLDCDFSTWNPVKERLSWRSSSPFVSLHTDSLSIDRVNLVNLVGPEFGRDRPSDGVSELFQINSKHFFSTRILFLKN